jgi:fumarate reductase subunit D
VGLAQGEVGAGAQCAYRASGKPALVARLQRLLLQLGVPLGLLAVGDAVGGVGVVAFAHRPKTKLLQAAVVSN